MNLPAFTLKDENRGGSPFALWNLQPWTIETERALLCLTSKEKKSKREVMDQGLRT